MPTAGKKIGLVLPHWEDFGETGRDTRVADHLATVAHCEERGFDSIWLVDHLVSEIAVDEADFDYELPETMRDVKIGYWECWTLLSAIAATTRRIELGTLVANTSYRSPGVLAQMVNTIEDLSDGRMILGLGAGDYVGEHHTFGFPFERRVSRFEEALQILRPLLAGERVSFEGEFYQVRNAEVRPPARRAGGPPVLIGMLKGGPRMKRLVAQHADVWNCWLTENTRIERYREARADIVAACERHGRDPGTLGRNVAIGVVLPGGNPEMIGGEPMTGSLESLRDQLGAWLEEDLDHLVVSLDPWSRESIDRFAQLLAELR